METITIPKKEYRELIQIREKLDWILKRGWTKERKPLTGAELLKLAKLKIKGGPKNLSEKAEFFLYQR